MAQSYKRRLIPVVDRRFQFKYTAIIVAIAALVSTVLGYFLLSSYLEMNEIVDLASLSPEVNDKLNTDDALRVFKLTLLCLVLEVLVVGVMGLLITHRVCGPVFVIHRHLESLIEGKYPSTRPLRAGDEFRETFEVFLTFVESIKKRDVDELAKLSAAIAAAKAKGVSDEELAGLQQLVTERQTRVSAKEG